MDQQDEDGAADLYEVVETPSSSSSPPPSTHHGEEKENNGWEKEDAPRQHKEERDEEEASGADPSYEVVLSREEEASLPLRPPATRAEGGEAAREAASPTRPSLSSTASHVRRSRKDEVGRELYWNYHFQEALCMEDSIQKFSRLSHIANDFQLAAKTYAQIIVSELNLPHDRKTIKPDKRLGGVAGGLKYIVQNILFKFALDTPRPQRPGKWMYGEDSPEDHNAIKVAAHELKSAISLLSVRPSNLCLPLMTLVDYRGFRLTAMSILPISKEENTLVYGSADQGKTIRNDDPEAMSAIQKAITKLNLNERLVREKLVWGPVDLEVHRGKDGRIYVLDMARIFPPDFIVSDAFSAFNHPRLSPHANQYNEEVSAMSRRLLYTIIPAFARKELLSLLEDTDDEIFFRGSGSIREEVDKRHQVLRKLCKDMHSWGINLRYFGRLRRELHQLVYSSEREEAIPNKKLEKNFRFLDSLLLTEMTTRVVKDIFHEQMRNKVKKVEVLSEEPYHQAAIKLFNLIIGTCSPKYETASNRFWTTTTVSQDASYSSSQAPASSLPEKSKLLRLRRERRNTLLGIYRSLAPSNDTLSSTATQEKKDEHSQVKSISQNKEPADEDDEESSWGDEEWDEQLDVVTRVSMKDRLMAKFGNFALDPEEVSSAFDLRNILSIRLLFIRLQELASLEYARHAEQQLLTSPHTFAFVEGDLLALNPRIKHMNLVDLASGRALYMQAMTILEERRNKNRGRKEAKRLLGLAQLRLENALSSATVEDVMDDCALLLVSVLFEYCRIDEDWDNPRSQHIFETAIKQLKEVLKREKIKQNIKEEQDRELAQLPTQSDALEESTEDATATHSQQDTTQGSREMRYLWGMILYEWGMRKLFVDSDTDHGAAPPSSSSSLSSTSLPVESSSSLYDSGTTAGRTIQKMFEEAEAWLVRAMKSSRQKASSPLASSSTYYKRVEKDVHELWEWAEKETGNQAVCLLINAAAKCKCLTECDENDNKAWLLWATTIGMLDMRVEGCPLPAHWNALLKMVTTHSGDSGLQSPDSNKSKSKGKRWLRQSIDAKVEIALRDKESVVAFCNSLSPSQRNGIIAALRPRSGSFARALHLLFSSGDTSGPKVTKDDVNLSTNPAPLSKGPNGDESSARPTKTLTRSLSKMSKKELRASREQLSTGWKTRSQASLRINQNYAAGSLSSPALPIGSLDEHSQPSQMASTTVRHYELSHNSSPLLPEGGTDDFEFRRRLGNDKERVWWAAVSKSQSIEVTIQKMTGVDLVTHRDVLTMASNLRKSLRHPNVSRLYDCFVVGNELWQVMQAPIADYSLKRLLRETKTLSEVTIAAALRQVAEGLNYLHQNGLVSHDRFSSSNLFVDRSTGTLLLMNSVEGHLRETEQKRDTFLSQETYAYSAPEVCGVKNKPTRVADTYSLGILAIELATGQTPFSGLSVFQQMTAKDRGPSPSLPSHKGSSDFREFIDMCLQKDPAKRPTIEEMLRHRFFEQVGGDTRQSLLQHLNTNAKSNASDDSSDSDDDDDDSDSDGSGSSSSSSSGEEIQDEEQERSIRQQAPPARGIVQSEPVLRGAFFDSLAFAPIQPRRTDAPSAHSFARLDDDAIKAIGELWKTETETELALLLRTWEGATIECQVRGEHDLELRVSPPPFPLEALQKALPARQDQLLVAGDLDRSRMPSQARLARVQLGAGRFDPDAAPVEVATLHPGVKLISVKKRTN